jgi:hypothetical protein
MRLFEGVAKEHWIGIHTPGKELKYRVYKNRMKNMEKGNVHGGR